MFYEYLRIAVRVLRAHKFRSSLTVLSITIGALSIVLMSSLAESGSTTLFQGLEEIGGGRLVCVVGHLIAKKLWDGDALGRWLTTHGVRCLVVGQLADQDRWGADFGFDYRDLVVVPRATLADVDPTVKQGGLYLIKTDEAAS